ncbi:MAG: T9SS type A sorting domain-containing protein [Chitinophagaceae bacterium]|nr:T9SS type A sorting domain-containing protein [Chitinophagaceae bacterium]
MRTLLFLLSMTIATLISAQEDVSNFGNLQVHSGASMSVFGAVTNTSTGVLLNQGGIFIRGNVSNSQASMAAGSGTLYLNGSLSQTISGTEAFNTFHLQTNNAAGILLNNNISVSGTHNFTAGMITTSITPNYLVYESGSNYTGDNDSRHVNGWVKKRGTTNFVFPVGNGSVERTIAIGSLSANSEFNVRYLPFTPFINQLQVPIRNVDEFEYWAINRVSGGTAAITMNWDFNKIYFPNWIVPDIRVAGYNGSLWVNNGGTASGTASTTGTITSASTSTFNLFTFGTTSYVVPLTLIGVNAYRQNDHTLVTWTTADEYNMNRFVAERSDDNTRFYPIAEVAARNTRNLENYQCRDYKPIDGIAYYRIRCIDNTGNEKLSRVIAVTDGRAAQLALLTNPVKDRIVLVASHELAGLFEYRLSTTHGQLLKQGKLSIQVNGPYELTLDQTVKPGTYFLHVYNSKSSFTFKILKE